MVIHPALTGSREVVIAPRPRFRRGVFDRDTRIIMVPLVPAKPLVMMGMFHFSE